MIKYTCTEEIGKNIKAALRWLSKDPVRDNLRFVHVFDGVMYAIDGRCMGYTKLPSGGKASPLIPDGAYHVVPVTKCWFYFMPADVKLMDKELLLNVVTPKVDATFTENADSIVHRLAQKGVWINAEFIKKATGTHKIADVYYHSENKGDKAVVVVCGGVSVVMMPIMHMDESIEKACGGLPE